MAHIAIPINLTYKDNKSDYFQTFLEDIKDKFKEETMKRFRFT